MESQQKPNRAPKNRRRKKHPLRRVVVLAFSVVVLFVGAVGLFQLFGGQKAQTGTVTVPASAQTVKTPPISSQSTPTDIQGLDWNIAGPVEQTINTMGFVAPDYRIIALPENGRIDASYFNTVTFLGDSISQGLEIYPNVMLGSPTFCTYKSISPKAIYDGSLALRADGITRELPMEALVKSQPDNVYILLGTNAMVVSDDESIITYYREMLIQIKANLMPGVGIYIQSITPVRPDNKNGFDPARIQALNNRLAQLAYEEGYYFLNISEALIGDDGYLREEYAGFDGVHLTVSGYLAWVEYLVTHTAYHPRNVYLEGSPYYRQ